MWYKRWRKESYKDLYRAIYGDERYEQDKGLLREYKFASSVSSMWRNEGERTKVLLKEARELLKENNLETNSMKSDRELLERYGL